MANLNHNIIHRWACGGGDQSLIAHRLSEKGGRKPRSSTICTSELEAAGAGARYKQQRYGRSKKRATLRLAQMAPMWRRLA